MIASSTTRPPAEAVDRAAAIAPGSCAACIVPVRPSAAVLPGRRTRRGATPAPYQGGDREASAVDGGGRPQALVDQVDHPAEAVVDTGADPEPAGHLQG